MTTQKHRKQLVRARMTETGEPYQTALQAVLAGLAGASSMPGHAADGGNGGATTRKTAQAMMPGPVLEPYQQVRVALDELTPAEDYAGDVSRVEAPDLVPMDVKVREGQPLAMVEPFYIPFRKVPFSQGDETFDVWRLDRALCVESWECEAAGGVAGLPSWLRARLGACCLRVDIHSYSDEVAEATIYAVSWMLPRRLKRELFVAARDWIRDIDVGPVSRSRLLQELREAALGRHEDGSWEICLPSLDHLDKAAQIEWPDLRVHVVERVGGGDMNAGKIIFTDHHAFRDVDIE